MLNVSVFVCVCVCVAYVCTTMCLSVDSSIPFMNTVRVPVTISWFSLSKQVGTQDSMKKTTEMFLVQSESETVDCF